jgi:hypothetical protein
MQPKRRRKKKHFEFGTYDIECDSHGRLLDVGVFYKGDFKIFPDWKSFYEFLVSEKPVLYAHNGGRFDSVGFATWLYRNEIKFTAALKLGRIINLQIGRASLRDSVCLLQASLEQLAQTFEIEGKIQHNYIERMQDLKSENPELYYEYLRRDCELLHDVLTRFDFELKEICDYGNLKVTIGSIAMAIYRKRFKPFEIYLPNPTEKRISRYALRGGRCEIYRSGYIRNVNIFDVNSLYPSMMMMHQFPFRGGVRTSEIVRDGEGKISCGFYRVKFRQMKGRLPILLDDDKRYIFKGEAWATHFELNYLESLGGIIEQVKEGYHYEFTDFIFKSFVKEIYELRRSATDDARKTAYKYLLNNLYGKFSQKDEYEVLRVMTLGDARALLEQGETVIPIIEESDIGLYSVMEKARFNVAFPAISALITAAGRVFLTSVMERYFENLIYCDTDSIHLKDILLESELIDSSSLGKFKPEFIGVSCWYFGKKQYVIEGFKTVQKGIPQSAIPSDFVDSMRTGEAEIAYHSPTLFKTAMRESIENPSQFAKRYKRVIRQRPIRYRNPFLEV